LDEHRSGTKGPNRKASKLMFLTCVRFRTKAPIFEFPRFRSAAALPWNPAADPTVPGRKAARVGAALPLSLVDLFNDRPFARLNHINARPLGQRYPPTMRR